VVPAVNDEHWAGGPPTGSQPQGNREVLRLGSMAARLKLKGIDGGSHKRWSMWLNSRLREEPYPGLDMRGLVGGNVGDAARWNSRRCCMAVVSSCREVLG